MADLDHIQWDNVTITEEDVLDPNPYLHLQNAWAALKAGRLRDVSQHLEYVQQTNTGDARVGKQYKELEDLLNPVNRLKKIYAAIDAGNIDDAAKDLRQLESSFSDDKDIQKECLKIHQEIGFMYLTEALKAIDARKAKVAESNINKAEQECGASEEYKKIYSLVRKELVILYLNCMKNRRSVSYAEGDFDSVIRLMNGMLPSEQDSVKQQVFNAKKNLCEAMIDCERQEISRPKSMYADLNTWCVFQLNRISSIESVIADEAALTTLLCDSINALKKDSALEALQTIKLREYLLCSNQERILAATKIMNSMKNGNEREYVQKQIAFFEQSCQAAQEQSNKQQKILQRKHAGGRLFSIVLDIPLGLLGAYIIRNRMRVTWLVILFVIVFVISSIYYVKERESHTMYDMSYGALFLPVFDFLCVISLVATLYFIGNSQSSRIAVLASFIAVAALSIAYGILKLYITVEPIDFWESFIAVPYILAVSVGAVILKYILSAFILPLLLPFLSSFSSFFHTLF